jgi:ubiquinone/menaquinone biosynthesis C-methylase UbiE
MKTNNFLQDRNMIERKFDLPQNSRLSMKYTIEGARRYEKGRFNKGKMLKYDKFEKAFAQRLFEMVGSDSNIVDIPCGSGRFFEIFSKSRKLIMADYSINMLRVCQEKFGIPDNVRLIRADISSIPLDNGEADLCFCMRLFHHMENDQLRLNALKELSRVSRRFVALSFYNHNLRFYRRKLLGKKITGNYTTYNHMVAIAKQIGLEPVERAPKVNFLLNNAL